MYIPSQIFEYIWQNRITARALYVSVRDCLQTLDAVQKEVDFREVCIEDLLDNAYVIGMNAAETTEMVSDDDEALS